jgi:hypothetical protein
MSSIKFDTTKPDTSLRKHEDIKRLVKIDLKHKIDLEEVWNKLISIL